MAKKFIQIFSISWNKNTNKIFGHSNSNFLHGCFKDYELMHTQEGNTPQSKHLINNHDQFSCDYRNSLSALPAMIGTSVSYMLLV